MPVLLRLFDQFVRHETYSLLFVINSFSGRRVRGLAFVNILTIDICIGPGRLFTRLGLQDILDGFVSQLACLDDIAPVGRLSRLLLSHFHLSHRYLLLSL